VKLLDLGIRILLPIIGLGLMPLVDQSLPIPGFGELAQGTGTKAREFVLVSDISAEAGSRQMSAILSTIYDAVKPDLVVKDQPLILRYQQQDEDGEPCGESLDILCKYRTGLEGQNDNNHSRRVAITFKQYIPYLKSTYDNGAALNYQLNVTDANYILKRSSDGVWSAMSTGTSALVRSIARPLDSSNSIYIGGDFTNLTDANGDYITKWNGAAFSSLGTGMNASVLALVVGPDGSLYAGGSFTLAGGVANTAHIAKWNGSAWSALGTGTNGDVFALAIGPDGSLYAGGQFALAGGVANTAGIAKWNGSVWSPLGTGMNAAVSSIVIGSDGTLYAGGSFSLASGVSNTAYIAKWNGSAWSALGTGMNSTNVWALAIGSDGTLYAGGSFTLAGGVANTVYIARWNGSVWSALGTGMNAAVYTLAVGPDGTLYAGGDFTLAGGVALLDRMAVWNGSVWLPPDVDLPGANTVFRIIFDKTGSLFIGYSTSGTAVTSINTSLNIANSIVYPIIIYVGPGTLSQLKNYTNGKAIYFNLTLLAGETAELNLDPFHSSFISSFRGDIWGSAILKGSNLNWFMQPGANNISSFIYGSTTAATAITIRWQDQYNSTDAAVWK
jgi:adhesin HecA-like repeat protein